MLYQEFEEQSGYDELSYEDEGGDQIVDNILFNSDDFISKPIKSEECTIDENIIQFQYPLLNQKLYLFVLNIE